jgi:hypothetical protein
LDMNIVKGQSGFRKRLLDAKLWDVLHRIYCPEMLNLGLRVYKYPFIYLN